MCQYRAGNGPVLARYGLFTGEAVHTSTEVGQGRTHPEVPQSRDMSELTWVRQPTTTQSRLAAPQPGLVTRAPAARGANGHRLRILQANADQTYYLRGDSETRRKQNGSKNEGSRVSATTFMQSHTKMLPIT